MNRTINLRRFLGAGAIVTSILIPATPAFAQDCFNASRSATGNTTAASNSGNWWSIRELLADPDVGNLTPDQVDRAMVVIDTDPRIPANFTVFYNPTHPGELASRMNPKNAANGHGIDHSDDYTTPVFAAIFQDVAIALG
jgi:hypothetical protein